MLCPIRIIYTIQPGDSIYRIANIFKTTVHNILDMNPGLVPNNLFIGTEITICPGAEFLDSLNDIIYPPARPIPPTNPVPPVLPIPPAPITPPYIPNPPYAPIMPFSSSTGQDSTTNNGVQYYRYN